MSNKFKEHSLISGPMAITLLGFFCFIFLFGCKSDGKSQKEIETSLAQIDTLQMGIRFNDITKQIGLGDFHYENGSYGEFFLPEIMGGSMAFIDFNGDNYQDLLIVKGGSMKEGEEDSIDGLVLYKNNEGLGYEDVTTEMGLEGVNAYGFGFTVGDYDNDGDDDFFLATLTNNRLFRNDGSKFSDVSKQSGIFDKNVWSASALFIDADRDGLLDIFVGNYAKWSRRKDRSLFCTENGRTDDYCSPDMYIGEPCSFYHNNGDGTFTEDAEERGLLRNSPTKTLGVVEVDYNRDGWPDLFTANDAVPDLVFMNNGDGTYTETGMAMGVGFGVDGSPTAGMGAAVGDVRNDGSHSVFIGNFSKKMMTVFRCTENGVYVNDSGPSLIGKQSLLTLNFGLSLFDAELDGDLDLFAANGHVFLSVGEKSKNITLLQRPHFFVNDGSGKFMDIVAKSPSFFKEPMLARSTAYADIDLDGDLDLVIAQNTGPIHIMQNDSETGNQLKILLKGVDSNINAIGAKITVSYGDGLQQVRYVKSSDSYLSQSEFPVTIGLAKDVKVDFLNILWPGGNESIFTDINANRFIRIEEGKSEYEVIKAFDAVQGS